MKESRLVYSTSGTGDCPRCRKPLRKCQCDNTRQNTSNDGIIRISRETKGRKGSGVTLITGLPMSAEELKQCAKQLKNLCGSGGTIKQGVIEIQGDHRQLIRQQLLKQYKQVKLAGG